MGTTTKGYPYPENSDAVANGADAIKALADFLNNNNVKTFHVGTVVVNVAATAVQAQTFNLPAGKFAAGAPTVVLLTPVANTQYIATSSNLTTTQFTVTLRHYNSTSQTVNVTVAYAAVLLG